MSEEEDIEFASQFSPVYLVLTTNEKLAALAAWDEDRNKIILLDPLIVGEIINPATSQTVYALRKWLPLSDDRSMSIQKSCILAWTEMSPRYFKAFNETRKRLYETEDGDLKETEKAEKPPVSKMH